MIKHARFLIIFALALFWPLSALAQFGPSIGPGPVPAPVVSCASNVPIVGSNAGFPGNCWNSQTLTSGATTYTFPNINATLLYSGGALGTPSSGSAANLTGLPISGLSGLGSGVGAALGIAADATGGIATWEVDALTYGSFTYTFPNQSATLAGLSIPNVFTVPQTVPTIYGGSAANSTLTLQSTSNGSPSGDQINIVSKTVNVGQGGGVTILNLGIPTASGGELVVANQGSGFQTWTPNTGTGTITFPLSTTTLPGLSLANQFTAPQTITTYDGVGVSIGLNTPSASEQEEIGLSDNDTLKWQIGKEANNSLFVFDAARNALDVTIASDGDMSLMSNGGGVSIGATSGLAVPNGGLTVGGNSYFGGGDPWVDAKSGANDCAAAAGNGSNDDTSAIQCQATYLYNTFGGGVVYFGPGNYHTTSTITVKGGVRFIGCGWVCAGIFVAGDTTAIEYSSASDGEINAMMIGGDQTSAATQPLIKVDSNSLVDFRDCYLSGGSFALETDGVDGHMSNCTVQGFGTTGGGIFSTGGNWYEHAKVDQGVSATACAFTQGPSDAAFENQFDMSDFSGDYTNSICVADTNNKSILTLNGVIMSAPVSVTSGKYTMISTSEFGGTTVSSAVGMSIVGSWAQSSVTCSGTGPFNSAGNSTGFSGC